jgi:SAM-dependent methyltransferase
MDGEQKPAVLPLSEESRGHHYGNFHQYYDFHNPSSRYSMILHNQTFSIIWNRLKCPQHFYLLDIGCNEGNLTIEMLQLAKQQLPSSVHCLIIGIDIDPQLISKAQEKYSMITDAIFITGDFLRPHVLSELMASHQIDKFSLVSAFSITMWVHMNHGDDGLNSFFQFMSDITESGLLIEPQKWISYRKAIQRCRRMKIAVLPHYQDLVIRDIESYAQEYFLKNHQMELGWRISCEAWGREALLFLKSI